MLASGLVCYKVGASAETMARIFDVTVPLTPGMLSYPGDPPFQTETVHRLGESPFALSRVSLATHAGTHVDAPAHLLAGGATVDHLPVEILLGKTRVVEVSVRERIERADLESHDLRDDLRVLVKSRMSGQMLRPPFQEDHVYFSRDAAIYLAQAGIKLVGFDYLSIDRFGAVDFPAHHVLLEAGVVIVEGLDLSEVVSGEYDMTCLPLRIADADGAPARVVLRTRG